MANPNVRPHMVFHPCDAGNTLSQTWEASKWLNEVDGKFLTPMARINDADYFIHEPALLTTRQVCMPNRWFTKDNKLHARVWLMRQIVRGANMQSFWQILKDQEYIVSADQFLLPFPALCDSAGAYGLPDPRLIEGFVTVAGGETHLKPWDLEDASPSSGNRWRSLAKGRKVVSLIPFPVLRLPASFFPPTCDIA